MPITFRATNTATVLIQRLRNAGIDIVSTMMFNEL